MKRTSTPLLLLFLFLLLIKTHTFYFNIGNFLKPILTPQQDSFGSALREDPKNIFQDTITYFDSHIQKHRHQFGINRFRRGVKQNLRAQQDIEDDLYKAIGIPEDIIYSKVLPIHMSALRDLNLYFPSHRITKKNLFESLKKLKQLIEWVTQNYLKDINNIIIGDNNEIKGKNIYLKGNNMSIRGSDDFIFNPNYQSKPIIGNNIVRIGAFDVDLDLIQRVKRCPEDAITFLEFIR